MFLIFSGDDRAISFNDDGSPDSRRTGGTKVWINGQVDRALPLDWYYQLIAFFPDVPGELKSALIVARFRSLPTETQIRIWRGLSRVRIHIVDPRPHYSRAKNILRRAWNRTDAPELLEQMLANGLPHAEWLFSLLREMVAESVLHDSAAMRVQSLGRILADPFGGILDSKLPFWFKSREETKPLVTLEAFGNRRDLVRQTGSWSVKSSAAFHSALDMTSLSADVATDVMRSRFFIGEPLLRRMAHELMPAHAFDTGNSAQIELLEQTRLALIDEVAKHDRLYGLMVPRGFVEVTSKESYYVQAADFAAGIASDVFASEGLTGVVLRFEHVTYNGVRVSLADAEEETKTQNMIEVDY